MIEIFRHHDSATVGLLKGLLEAEGIRVFLRNEALSNTAYGIENFNPALCVLDPEDAEHGRALIRTYLDEAEKPAGDPLPERSCPNCGERVPGNFADCWNCGNAMQQ